MAADNGEQRLVNRTQVERQCGSRNPELTLDLRSLSGQRLGRSDFTEQNALLEQEVVFFSGPPNLLDKGKNVLSNITKITYYI